MSDRAALQLGSTFAACTLVVCVVFGGMHWGWIGPLLICLDVQWSLGKGRG